MASFMHAIGRLDILDGAVVVVCHMPMMRQLPQGLQLPLSVLLAVTNSCLHRKRHMVSNITFFTAVLCHGM
jgi:hypothetical protein